MRKRDAIALSRRLAAALIEIEAVRDAFDNDGERARSYEHVHEIADKITDAITDLEVADGMIGEHFKIEAPTGGKS